MLRKSPQVCTKCLKLATPATQILLVCVLFHAKLQSTVKHATKVGLLEVRLLLKLYEGSASQEFTFLMIARPLKALIDIQALVFAASSTYFSIDSRNSLREASSTLISAYLASLIFYLQLGRLNFSVFHRYLSSCCMEDVLTSQFTQAPVYFSLVK